MRSRVQLREVTDGVWCFRQRSYVCCSYAVADRAGLVLVDAGMTSDAAPVLHGLAQLGRTLARLLDLPIRFVCPGHRAPLTAGVDEQVRSLGERVRGSTWPLLG